MKKLILICLVLAFAASTQAQVSAGVRINDDGQNSFYLAIGQTYRVPQQEVVVVHQRNIPDEEIPVVYFIARRAHVRPEAIIDLRLAGQSWMDITLHYHLRPSIYYVALNGDPGPDYGRVYGHWRQPRREWTNMRLEDDDIIKMVNLQFVSSHYGVKTDEVVRLRGEQGNFVKVNSVVSAPEYRSNRGKADKQDAGRGNDKGHGNGKGQGNGNGNSQKDKNH